MMEDGGMGTESLILHVDVLDYEGPLDLLSQLIDKNRVPIDRVSIASIADQYLEKIRGSLTLDMELASSFLLMAATLIQLKSSLLLPDRRLREGAEEMDPGDQLIVRLLQYRRCKFLALTLKERYRQFSGSFGKPPEPVKRTGVERERAVTALDRGRFDIAVGAIQARNDLRFHDSGEEVGQILERERVSLRERMMYIVQQIAGRARVFFYEIFPPELPVRERVTGFLAMLELVFQSKAQVTQKALFAPILIERKSSRRHEGRRTHE